MSEQRARQPGRRHDDLVAYEILERVRAMLTEEYVSKVEAQRDYVPRSEHRQRSADRDRALMLCIVVLQLVTTTIVGFAHLH